MSGRYVRLTPGRYTLAVSEGEGPAGVHRRDGEPGVAVDIDGGRVDFTVRDQEDAFYWWRGPQERPGVRLFGVSRVARESRADQARPTGTTG